jgi:hypothetical protein
MLYNLACLISSENSNESAPVAAAGGAKAKGQVKSMDKGDCRQGRWETGGGEVAKRERERERERDGVGMSRGGGRGYKSSNINGAENGTSQP